MVIGGAAGAAGGVLGVGMPAFGAAAAALSGVASIAAASLIGSTTSFLTGENTLSVGLLSYNFNRGGLENPFGGVQQSIFSSLDIAGMVLPAVGGVASALTKTARGAASAESSVLSPENRQRLNDFREAQFSRDHRPGGRGRRRRGRLVSFDKLEGEVRRIQSGWTRPALAIKSPELHMPGWSTRDPDALYPHQWRLRQSLYREHKRNTIFYPVEDEVNYHPFRTTDTHYVQVLRRERRNVRSTHLQNALSRLTKNTTPAYKAAVKNALNYIQRRYDNFPYSRLTRENLVGFLSTRFEIARVYSLQTRKYGNYISITMPRLTRPGGGLFGLAPR
ncbi:hypothetical protein Barb6XT_02742 [Bacteroidales bacterium Barb6XT]|nr:hypothetical protein Barb6XT_02742 [Bacteroidales bacterium Barb6XT]